MKKLFFILICILALSGCSNEEAQKIQEAAKEVPPIAEEKPQDDVADAPLLEISISENAVAAMNTELDKQENQSKIYKVVYNHAGNG